CTWHGWAWPAGGLDAWGVADGAERGPGGHSTGSRPVRSPQVFGALHLDQARGGALERALQALAGIQLRRRHVRGADQVDLAVVQLVDQVDEAARGVLVERIHFRDATQQDGVELARDLDVVGGAARAFAQGAEVEPGDALAACAHRNLAIVDLDVAASGASAAAELAPAIAQPGVGAIVQRRAVYRRAGQRAQAVILLAVGAQHHAVLLQQVDRRQEAGALQAVA